LPCDKAHKSLICGDKKGILRKPILYDPFGPVRREAEASPTKTPPTQKEFP